MTRQFVHLILQSALLVAALGLTSGASAQDASGFCMYLYTDWDLEGSAFYVRKGETVSQLNSAYNDKISSFEVIRGCKCRIYEDFNQGGDAVELDARHFRITVSQIEDDWNDTISSIQCDR